MSEGNGQQNHEPRPSLTLNHPSFALVKQRFGDRRLRGTEFRGQASLVIDPADLHEVLAFLRHEGGYAFLSDIGGVDYMDYPSAMPARFGVVYNLVNPETADRFFVKVYLDPSLPTEGIEPDPALALASVTDLWPGAEWMEREVFDMFGIRFNDHPDLRRILLWEGYPGHPLRKDYPLRGRGEREAYQVVDRTTS